MKLIILLAGLFFLSVHVLVAQEDSSSAVLKEVVISAQRKSTELLKVPYMVASAGKDYFRTYQPRTTPEALQGMAGVFVQKTNHGGGSPFVRGLTGNQVLMLVDGIRLNNSTFRYGPNQYLNTIDPYSIDRIEVAKGTGSVQYGSDAMGGVIQVFTKEPAFSVDGSRWNGSLTGKLASRAMEQTGRGEIQYSGKHFAAAAGVSIRNFGDLWGGDTTGKQSPSGYQEQALDLKLKFKLSKNTQLIAAHQLLRQTNVPVYHKIVLENYKINETDPQQRMLSYARFEVDGSSRLMKQLQITASWQHSIEGRNSLRNGSAVLRREKDEVTTPGLTADLYSVFSKKWSANSGIELYRDKVRSLRKDITEGTGTVQELRGLYPHGAAYGNYSVYSLHHFEFNRLGVEIGARFNVFDIRLTDGSLGKVKVNPSALVGNAALIYDLNKHHKVFVSLSNGYRAPNIDDMGTLGIVDFRYEIPTAGLNPERSRTTELGYKFAAEKLSGAASVYYMQLKDLITRVRVIGDSVNGYPVYRKENTEQGYIGGFEAGLTYRLIEKLTVSGNLAYNYGKNKTRNEPMRRIPPVHGSVMTVYAHTTWQLSAEWLYAGKQDRLAQGDKDDNRIPEGGTPSFNLLNLYAGYSWKIVQLRAGIQNIFNEDYRTHGSGINGAGRSVWLSVQCSL